MITYLGNLTHYSFVRFGGMEIREGRRVALCLGNGSGQESEIELILLKETFLDKCNMYKQNYLGRDILGKESSIIAKFRSLKFFIFFSSTNYYF